MRLSRLRVSRQEARLVAVVAVALVAAAALVPEGPASVAGRAGAIGSALLVTGSLLWLRVAPAWAVAAAIAGGTVLQALCPFVGAWGGGAMGRSRWAGALVVLRAA